MSTKYKYPSELLYEATAVADGDWVVVQKDGESRLSKISGANFGNISALAKTDGNIVVGDGTKWVAESGATARASLGLTIDSHVQGYNAGLAAIAALAKTDGNFVVGNGTTWVAESGATAQTSLGLAIGVNVQGYSTYLAALTGGNVTVSAGTVTFNGSIEVGTSGGLRPTAANTYRCGISGQEWLEVRSYGYVTASDEALKKDIEDSDLGLSFIDNLRPVKYRFIVGANEPTGEKDEKGLDKYAPRPGVRFHYGLLAGQVKAAAINDFGGYIKDDATGIQALRYGEFIAPLIKAVQELHGLVQEERQARLALEQRLAALEITLAPSASKQPKS